jgi:hypothetical protein
MSYWSLRRVADRAAAGHELARTDDDRLAPARTRLPDWTPVATERHERHAARVSSPGRTLRQRAADLEAALWTVPTPDPADVDPYNPGGVRLQVRSSW